MKCKANGVHYPQQSTHHLPPAAVIVEFPLSRSPLQSSHTHSSAVKQQSIHPAKFVVLPHTRNGHVAMHESAQMLLSFSGSVASVHGCQDGSAASDGVGLHEMTRHPLQNRLSH